MELSVLGPVRDRWRQVIGIAVLVAMLAFAASFLFAPRYSATSGVLVRARETRLLTSTGTDSQGQPIVDSTLAKSLVQTNSALATSRSVAEEVVRTIGVDQLQGRDDSFFGTIRQGVTKVRDVAVALVKYGMYRESTDPFETAVQDVQQSLEAKPVKDSYLIEIRAWAGRPDLAAKIADAAAASLAKVGSERSNESAIAYRDFLQVQSEKAKTAVDAVQQKIQQYKEDQGIVDVSEELRLAAGTKETVSDLLRTTNVDLESARAQLAAVQRAIANTPATETASSSIATGRSTTTTNTTSPSRVYQDLLTQRATLQSAIASLEARQTSLSADLQTRDHLLPGQEARLADLERQLNAATDTYKSVRAAFDGASLNTAQGAVEVSVTDKAAAPLYPDRPLRYLFALLGFVFGLIGGAGLALLADRGYVRMRFSFPRIGIASPAPVHASHAPSRFGLAARLTRGRERDARA